MKMEVRLSKSLWLFVLSLMSVSSCGKKPTTAGVQFDIVGVTEKQTMAGVYSNVRGNVEYRVSLEGVGENVLFEYLEVDSVRLKPEVIYNVSEKKLADPSEPISFQASGVELKFWRILFNTEGPKMVDEIEYEKSPITHKTGGRLMGKANGQTFSLTFKGTIVLQSLNAP